MNPVDSIDFDKEWSEKMKSNMAGKLSYNVPLTFREDSSSIVKSDKRPQLHLVLQPVIHDEHQLNENIVKPKPLKTIAFKARIVSCDHPKPHIFPDTSKEE